MCNSCGKSHGVEFDLIDGEVILTMFLVSAHNSCHVMGLPFDQDAWEIRFNHWLESEKMEAAANAMADVAEPTTDQPTFMPKAASKPWQWDKPWSDKDTEDQPCD